MDDQSILYVLLTQYGQEPTDVWVFASRGAAERALLELAEREWGMFATDAPVPPTTTEGCVSLLTEQCDYGSVRLIRAELGARPGDYKPLDLIAAA